MMMDYRPQQPGEHDFVYAARILRAAATEFDAIMANGSYSLAQMREMKTKLAPVMALLAEPPVGQSKEVPRVEAGQ